MMRLRTVTECVTGLAMIAVFAAVLSKAHADDVAPVDKSLTQLTPGAWLLTRTMTIPGFPLPPKPRIKNICFNAGKGMSALDFSAYKTEDIYEKNCKFGEVTKTEDGEGKHIKINLICTPDLASKGSLEFVTSDNKHISSTLTLVKDGPDPWLVYHDVSEWQGECPKQG